AAGAQADDPAGRRTVSGEGGTRRALLAGAVAGGGALLAPATVAGRLLPDPTAWRPRRPLARGGRFAQGVMSGQPDVRGITLWTQLERPELPGALELEVARDPGFSRVVQRARVPVRANAAGTASARVEGPMLRPHEQYWYRFATADGSSPVGRFRTLPPADSATPVRIGFWSCQMYFMGFFTGQAALAEEDLDLVVCLGDYVYDTYLDLTRREPRPAGGAGSARTLPEYRAKYAVYRSDADLRRMHARHAFVPVWDDHEVANDYDGEGVDGEGGPAFAARRAAAYRAWFEHMPVEQRPGAAPRVHRRLRIGRLLDLFLLDTRQYARPGGTLLGEQQRRWLLEGLTGSRAAWKLLGNPVMLMDMANTIDGAVIGAPKHSWQAHPGERRLVGETLRARGVQDVVSIAGDAHAFYAGTATTEGGSRGIPFATEVVAGTMAASNLATSALELLSPLTGPLAGGLGLAANPHLVFSDAATHGYAVVEARRDELRVALRAVDTILRPTASVRTLASFRVPRGRVAVERVG
ncbi:alkaline phosphatase D family protein, partial [Patulibacter defluvii]|uniref:alkaline phosphatase D family protein n=1 Tax=Patulibacter defluvii TaxID=3095358 RepID=UPI002A752D5C